MHKRQRKREIKEEKRGRLWRVVGEREERKREKGGGCKEGEGREREVRTECGLGM